MEYPSLFEPANEGGFVIAIPAFGWGISQAGTEPRPSYRLFDLRHHSRMNQIEAAFDVLGQEIRIHVQPAA